MSTEGREGRQSPLCTAHCVVSVLGGLPASEGGALASNAAGPSSPLQLVPCARAHCAASRSCCRLPSGSTPGTRSPPQVSGLARLGQSCEVFSLSQTRGRKASRWPACTAGGCSELLHRGWRVLCPCFCSHLQVCWSAWRSSPFRSCFSRCDGAGSALPAGSPQLPPLQRRIPAYACISLLIKSCACSALNASSPQIQALTGTSC